MLVGVLVEIPSRVVTGPSRCKAGPWCLSSHAAVSGPQSPPSRTRGTFDNTQRAVPLSGASTFAVGAEAGAGKASSLSSVRDGLNESWHEAFGVLAVSVRVLLSES